MRRSFVVALAVLAALPFAGTASASNPAVLPPTYWIMKHAPDLEFLQQWGLSPSVTFGWTLCGFTTAPNFGDGSNGYGACHPGQVPVYASYAQLAEGVIAGTPQQYGYALYDPELWKFTPENEQDTPEGYIKLADQMAAANGFRLIVTPYAATPGVTSARMAPAAIRQVTTTMISEEVTAAQYGAYAVDIQAQFANADPNGVFKTFATQAIKSIRAASPTVIITVGLTTNNPVPQTVAHLVADYNVAVAAGAQGFWLNVPNWGPKNQCDYVDDDGPGCPLEGIGFLKALRVPGA